MAIYIIVGICIVVASVGVFLSLRKSATGEIQPVSQGIPGLEITDSKEGTGTVVKRGDTVSVHYAGTLQDGTKFDSSRDRGTPFSFTVGAGQVIKGWDRGVVGMKLGGTRRLVISPDLAYGAAGVPGAIPPNATLIFEVEALSIQNSQ